MSDIRLTGNVKVDAASMYDMGDAIREVSNSTDTFIPSQMGAAIRQLRAADEDTNAPQYIKNEAARVAAITSRVITEKSLVLGCVSDIHYGYFNTLFNEERCREILEHTGQALNIIKKLVGFDGCLMLGDTIDGGRSLIKSDAKDQFDTVNKCLQKAFANVPNFRLNGNHDILRYRAAGSNLSADELYEKIGKFNTSDVEKTNRNYGYHDFEDKKIRLIYLNTCDSGDINIIEDLENGFTNFAFSSDQLTDFVSYLDLSDKTNPSEWRIISIGHHPLDFGSAVGYSTSYTDASGNTFDLYGAHILAIINAYMQGTAGNIVHNGSTISYDFTGSSRAQYIGHLHGHVHNFSSGKIKINSEQTEARRITIPNMHPFRQNDSGGSYAEFHEETSFPKTIYTENETAFNIVVINPDEEKIYCFNYGAGYDRTIYYGFVPVDVTALSFENENYIQTVGEALTVRVDIEPANATDKNIKWSSSDESIASVKTGSLPQEVIITPKKSGTVTITAAAHNGITASLTLTVSPKQIINVFNQDGNAKDGYRLSKDTGLEKTEAGYTVSGYIAFDGANEHTLYVKNTTSFYNPNSNPNFIIAVYDTKKNFIASSYIGKSLRTPVRTAETRDDDVTVLHLYSSPNWSYIRLCCLGYADDVIITIDADPNDESNTISFDSIISDIQEYARLESSVENIAEDYLSYEDDPEMVIEPEWEAHIGTIDGFFSNLKQNLEETYIGGEQNVNA